MTVAKFFHSRRDSLRRGVNEEWHSFSAGKKLTKSDGAGEADSISTSNLHETHVVGEEKYRRKTIFEGLASDLIFEMEPEKITCMRHALRKGVSMQEFIELMRQYLPKKTDHIEEEDLIANLVEFFREVNLHGDAKMRWNEFVAFMSEAGHSKIDNEAGYVREQPDHELHAAKEVSA